MKNVHKYKINNYLLEKEQILDVHLCAYVILLSIFSHTEQFLCISGTKFDNDSKSTTRMPRKKKSTTTSDNRRRKEHAVIYC